MLPTPSPGAPPLTASLHEHLHLAATGQPDFPGAFVGHAEIQQLRRAGFPGLQGRVGDRALDAAAATEPSLPSCRTA